MEEFPGRLFNDPLDEQDIVTVKNVLISARKLIIELGSGAGGHLIELARQEPTATCIGLELRYKRAFRTLEKGERYELTNLYVYRGDGRKFLRELVTAGAVDTFYVNFPDPWPKRREQKNRVLSPNFLNEIDTWLKPEGRLIFRTDQRDYFDQVVMTIESSECPLKIIELSNDLKSQPLSIALFPTEFEGLFLRKGDRINALIATR